MIISVISSHSSLVRPLGLNVGNGWAILLSGWVLPVCPHGLYVKSCFVRLHVGALTIALSRRRGTFTWAQKFSLSRAVVLLIVVGVPCVYALLLSVRGRVKATSPMSIAGAWFCSTVLRLVRIVMEAVCSSTEPLSSALVLTRQYRRTTCVSMC